MFCWAVHKTRRKSSYHHVSVAVEHNVYCFGGDRDKDTDQIEVHVFNTVSLCWKKLPSVTTGRKGHLEVPSMRYYATAVLIEDTVYLLGGCNYKQDKYYNVLYEFDVNTHRWKVSSVSGALPGARAYHSACVLGKAMYVYGGYNLNGWTNEFYELDTSTMVCSLINTRGIRPPGSYGHSATIIGTKMFVFGGIDSHGKYCNNINVFDTETNCWLNKTSAQLLPERRCCHSAFAYNGELYIFGGSKIDRSFSDLWRFSPETFTWRTVEPRGKHPHWRSGMCSCMVGDRIILFGGHHTPEDLYILHLSPSLKTLCKLAVVQYDLEQVGLPHDIRWELAAMATCNRKKEKQTNWSHRFVQLCSQMMEHLTSQIMDHLRPD